ncbi:MAG: prepilin-type N-terminal cleavage/methylation domain-containing protein [Verrucomicrobiae bacterium]|nr:prepilin-type N-terminal cleavage/methylation domain-containing protein [Verrucomicrobiae bacterium]
MARRCGTAAGNINWRTDAFSLVEVMVAVTILTVITVGLLMMFNQTQRAFRGSLTQTDVTQSARIVGEVIASELAQAQPAGISNAVNFLVRVPSGPFFQKLPSSAGIVVRTNVCQDVFFLVCENRQWTALGYRVFPTNAGAAALYRFSTNLLSRPPARLGPSIGAALGTFLYANPATAPGHFRRMADGVVHFRIRALGTEYLTNAQTGMVVWTNHGVWLTRPITNEQGAVIVAVRPDDFNRTTGEYNYTFFNNALPMLVELELGIVEAPTLERMRALANSPGAAAQFLAERPQAVHLYRQLLRIRSADAEPYKLNLARFQ